MRHIFCNESLTTGGSRILNITGSYIHGIVSDDKWVINGSTMDITAVNIGFCLNGKIGTADVELNINHASDGKDDEDII